MKKKLNIQLVYETYPFNYPPFKSFLEFLISKNILDVKISVFKKDKNTPKNVFVMPNYRIRKIYEIVFNATHKLKSLKYPEIYWIKQKTDIVHLQNSFMFYHIKNIIQIIPENRPKIVISLVGGETYVKPWVDKKWIDFYKENGNKVQSQNQKEYITKWGIDKSKVFVIPVSFGKKSKAYAKYPNEKIMKIASAYRMTWEKNIEGSVRFAKLLKEKNIKFQYDIYGDGDDWGQLYYLVDKYKLQDCVNIKGKIANDVLKQKLPDYDFFMQLSICEALSASVIEAQSFGVVGIVSDSDGIKEAIIPGKTGICNAYYNLDYLVTETISIWESKEKYYQFSKDAIDYVNEFYSLEVEAERTIAMYNSII
jgi:glycosyltransferase involved in cell wall biosynthesis